MFPSLSRSQNQTSLARRWVEIMAVVLMLTSCQPSTGNSPGEPPAADLFTEVDASMRTVEHALGTAQVPLVPERVVVLDTAALDAAIALGTMPVGSIAYGALPAYLGDEIETIAVVGDGNQPNLEAILQLKPDLILGTKPGTEKIYDQLSQIAPTVLSKDSGRVGDWPEHFRLYAEALGKPEQAELLLQDYQAQVAQLQQQLGQPEATTVSVISPFEGQPWTYTTGSFPGSVLQDIGLSRNSAQSATRRYALKFSMEALDKLDGDYIFLVYSDYFPGSIKKESFVSDPIWSQLSAVKQENVCEVPNNIWIAGRSILAANQILIDVEQCLAPDN